MNRMDVFTVNKLLISICACWASLDEELGLPVNAQLRLMDSLTLAWSVVILGTSLLKFFSLNLGLDVTRGATFTSSSEPTSWDLLTINYLPRINEFEKLYYGLVSVSIGTSLFWRLYLRFYRTSKRAHQRRADPTRSLDAKCSLMRFFFAGPTNGGRPQAAQPDTGSTPSGASKQQNETAAAEARSSLASSNRQQQQQQWQQWHRSGAEGESAGGGNGDHHSAAAAAAASHLEWVELYECRAVRRDLLAGCSGSQELLVRSNNQNLERDHPASSSWQWQWQRPRRRRHPSRACQTGPLSTLHTGESHWRPKEQPQPQQQQQQPRLRRDTAAMGKLGVPAAAAAAAGRVSPATDRIEPRRSDVFTNPVRSGQFLAAADSSWLRWHYIARNLRYVMAFIAISTMPIMYYTIDGLHAVMRNFSYDRLDNRLKSALYYYGIAEQVYACTQAALFFIFTNIFITIFHADIQFKINTIKRDLRNLNGSFRSARPRSRPPKLLIYYQQFRLWAFFDHIQQLDTFVCKYSLVSMAAFIIGISFGQSFLKVQEYSLKTGTAAVLLANFLSFTFLYVISWDIERRQRPTLNSIPSIPTSTYDHSKSERLHSTLLTIAARDYDFLIKRLWLKTLFGFFERDGRRTFTLDSMYPLNLHSYFKTIFGWLTMSLLINRLFHKRSWDTTFET